MKKEKVFVIVLPDINYLPLALSNKDIAWTSREKATEAMHKDGFKTGRIYEATLSWEF